MAQVNGRARRAQTFIYESRAEQLAFYQTFVLGHNSNLK